ncbi:MAG: EAL domain-containing protein (putative c-di-GMP-specific phosphodiesterase class I) [Bermanella sp.]|jgi:EAL domain-containing protein (putative c-di-GMP-specific phosphodiesterase class I)
MTRDVDLSHFFPYYQPIVDVQSGEIGGYEVLARHKALDGSIVSAWPFFSDDDISTKQKLEICRYVRAKALSTFSTLGGDAFLSLNISPALMDPTRDDSGGATISMLNQYNIAPGRVVAEILESPGERGAVQKISKRFHQAGLQIAIDDFGAGHSHMERLFDLKPNYLKIDMHLLRLATRGGVRADYLQALRYVTERNSIHVVCEGVETEDEFMFAMDCGARYIQGFIFSPAVAKMAPVDTFRDHVTRLRKLYLKQRVERLARSAQHQVRVEAEIQTLQSLMQNDDVKSIHYGRLRELGVFRFFTCTPNGEQVSSNYNLLNKLTVDRKYYGYNWSTSLYFAELVAMLEVREGDTHIIQSSVYMDRERQQLCRTYGIGLNNNLLLLVDVREEDLLAYVRD